MKVRAAVPRRPDGGRRDELWAFCERWWRERFPDWEIVTADSDGDLFNRGQAINNAARGGDWDLLVVLDADVAAETAQVQAALDRAAETGRCTLAYETYVALPHAMTEKVLRGFNGRWDHSPSRRMASHCSSIVVVPRPLWDAVDGFDERCEGWGQDDTIFAHSCRVLGGGIERVPGTVYHLNHPVSRHANRNDPHKQASDLLAHRYFAEHTVAGVRAIIDERHSDDMTLVVLTDGRRECIERSIPAAFENLKGIDFDWPNVWICDDSGDLEYGAWLRWRFPEAHVLSASKRSGYAGACQRARATAIAAGQPWVFWLEDDFEVTEPIDLRSMADILATNPSYSQVMLRRQPWFPAEIEAGGFVEQNPDAYTEHVGSWGTSWLEHQLGHWTNPHLTTRSFLIENPWPSGAGSERAFGRQVKAKGYRSAILGRRTDPPKVLHMGERRGTGY